MPFSAGLLVPPRDLALPVAARLLTLALLLAPSSCGDIETRPGCPEPGIARECACEGGGSGTQMCQAERVWEACTCDDLDLDFEVDTGDGGGDLDADDPVIDPTPDPDVVEDPDADAIVDPDVSADADADAGGDDATDANADADADAPLVNECDEMTDTCDEHADCIDLDDGYDCTCQEDYVGNGFECFLGTECVPSASICDANAECASFGSVFLCVCNDGYTGDGVTSCTNVDECDSAALNDCDPNADCTDNEGSYECECRAGFDGDGTFCDDINECSGANPCGAGSCTNASPGYNCACDPGYVTTGGFFPTCELIDECTDVALHDCDPNGTCTNGAGLGYDCTCNMGYVESPGTFPTCNVRNECTDGSHTCAPGGTCTNGGSFGYDCNCQQGYETTGGDFPSCSVIDECNLANDPCGPNGECANGTGVGYECTCDAGYLETAGQFPTCQPENECVTGNHSCAPGGTCTNGGGFGYDCNCQQGYETTGGDFPSCSVIDECTLGVDPCGPNGDCTNGAGLGYDCACDTGYLESPGQFPTCQPENECTTGNHTCAPNGTCTNGAGFGYDCNCGAGFVDDGADFSSCVFEDECTTGTHNCGAFGTCVNGTDFGYECACDLGYYQTDETFPTCLSECAGQPDLSRCAWSQPDYHCFSDVCRPLACGNASCNPGGPHFQLADTGQIECRTQDAEPITCCVDGGMLACGQDAEYGLDRSRSGRFDVLGNTVDDLATGLQWTRCPLGRTGNGCSNGANTTVPWAEAVEVCRALSLGGQGDWRLPDRYELASLIDYSTSSAHIDTTAFTATSFDWMWTSSTSAASSADAWAVRLNSQVSELPKTENHELRCVRGTPSPLPAVRFTNLAGDPVTAGDMIVVDHDTQLAWARQPQADILGWEAGLAYCDGLTTGGFTDWRLPNPPELESLLDMRRDDYIDLAVFPNATDFFTGTHGIDITLAHLVSTRTGERLWNGSDASSYGRCVRALPRRPHRVFTTSATYTGDLISEANALVHADFPPERAQDAADAICQWHANQVGIGGHFVAAITTSQSGFLAGVDDDDGPWALVDGTPVTTRASAFLDGRLINAFERNELGGLIPDARTAWTGGVFDCSGWTSTAGNGIYGSATSVGNSFRSFGNPGCNQRRSLYCVEVGPGAGPIALPELPGGALLAFTTTNSYTGDLPASGGGGLGSHVRADLLCQASAGVGGHSGTWRAWLSVSGSSAADYFAEHGMDGPWYREDGFLVASSLSDLTDGNGSTGHLNIGPSGAYLTHANNFSEFVWTGTDRTGMTTTNCLNFGSTTGTGTYGRATTHRAAWTAESTRPCDESLRLYCFQETTGSTGGL